MEENTYDGVYKQILEHDHAFAQKEFEKDNPMASNTYECLLFWRYGRPRTERFLRMICGK